MGLLARGGAGFGLSLGLSVRDRVTIAAGKGESSLIVVNRGSKFLRGAGRNGLGGCNPFAFRDS